MYDDEESDIIKELAQSGADDLKNRVKVAFKNAYKMNPALFIKVGAIIFAILIFIIIIAGLIIEDEEFANSANTDESRKTIGKDYVVNTAISEEAIIITDKDLLVNAINSLGYSDQAKYNLTSNIDAFLKVQEQYNVNAVFAMAVTVAESSAGSNWELIDSSTYNWCSLKVGSSWTGETYTDTKGTVWRKYGNFQEAIYDFGNLISTSSYYFGGENYTVSSIAPSYCNEQWGTRVIEVMTDIFEACGIDTSGYIDISGSEILSVAAELFNKVHTGNYIYGGTSIPPTNGVIDCSAYVDWVLYELGYTDFGGGQRDTEWWYNIDAESRGWTEFYIGDNDISVLQPGDIIVLRGTSKNKVTGNIKYEHHMQIFVSAKDETHAYVYDCGDASNWSVNTPTKGYSTFWGYERAKVIRIKND